MNQERPLRIFTGNANRPLVEGICDHLGIRVGRATVGRFPDGEIEIKVEEDVRGADVFIVQPTSPPVDEHLMEVLILVDCLRRASADRITAVLPYYGYARKDRKDEGRVPITAKLVANLLTAAGIDRMMAMDLHADQIQGFFDIPFDHIYASKVLVEELQSMAGPDLAVVAPDLGSVKMANFYAEQLGGTLAIIHKRRISGSETQVGNFIGDVAGKRVIILDDMISTAGSICEAARVVRERGAAEVTLATTHAVFCGPAIERLKAAPVDRVIVTNTIDTTHHQEALPTLKPVSVAPLLGEAIRRVHHSESVSSLFL